MGEVLGQGLSVSKFYTSTDGAELMLACQLKLLEKFPTSKSTSQGHPEMDHTLLAGPKGKQLITLRYV